MIFSKPWSETANDVILYHATSTFVIDQSYRAIFLSGTTSGKARLFIGLNQNLPFRFQLQKAILTDKIETETGLQTGGKLGANFKV